MPTKSKAENRSRSVPVSTVVRLVRLLEEENLLDQFILSSHALRVDLSPLTSFLNGKGVDVPQARPIPIGAAAAAVRIVHHQFAEEFAANDASAARVNVSPRVIYQAKKFIANNGIDRRNQFAASIAGTNPRERCPGPDPYRCPHIDD
jgi:hypothetical protein